MKFHPILFSTPMVQAILEGRKTMTRRIINFKKIDGNGDAHLCLVDCPYGNIGDVLWVRETWAQWDFPKNSFAYKADGFIERYGAWERDTPNKFHDVERVEKWRPSRFMPKKACRLFLEITGVRVERLHEITESDAVAEGINPVQSFDSGAGISERQLYENYCDYGYTELLPKDSFMSLWYKINGEESWNANPWVWVVEFKKGELTADQSAIFFAGNGGKGRKISKK